MPEVAAIIAGGAGRRLGGAGKAGVMLAGRSLLEHVLGRLQPQVGAVMLNLNGGWLQELGLPVRPDGVAGLPGPLAGILAAMDWAAKASAARVVTVAVDTPFLPHDLVARLVAAAGDGAAVAATRDGGGALRLHPVAGLWPVTLRHRLRGDLAAGVRRVADWAMAQGAAVAEFAAAEPDPFLNINTPDDLARAGALVARGG